MSEISKDLERAISSLMRHSRDTVVRGIVDGPGVSPTSMLVDALIDYPVELALQIESGVKAPRSLTEQDQSVGHDAGGAAEAMGENAAGESENTGQGQPGSSDTTRDT